MRNVIFDINISIDGCYEHTNFGPDEELYEYFTAIIKETDLTVYGRKTYELMIPYWPDVASAPAESAAEHEFAQTLTGINRVVFSRTLGNAYENTRIIRENLEHEILKLKQQPGKKIAIGGVNLASQLVKLGLVDEFYFVVRPAVVGKGKSLWDEFGVPERLNLKLVDTKVFKSGAVGLHYLKQ